MAIGCVAALVFAASGFKILQKLPLEGAGGWDYVTFDGEARRLYISHSTQVDVVNPDTGKQIGVIADTPGVHGVALAHEFKHGFTSNGREHKVSMFDPQTLALIKKIDVGKGPDGIYYHAATKRVFTCNHGSNDMTAIDAKTGDVVGTVKLNGAGEQMVTGKDGLIYVTVEDTAEVAGFDPKTLEVKHRYPIGLAKTPTGLAYDAKNDRFFIGCRENPMMVVMNSTNGKVITSFPIGAGVDWAEFDAAAKTAFLSSGDGTLAIFEQKSADSYEAGSLTTQQSAKTMAFDPKSKKIYLPAAEYTTTPNADSSKRPTRTMKPGSFVLLVVGK